MVALKQTSKLIREVTATTLRMRVNERQRVDLIWSKKKCISRNWSLETKPNSKVQPVTPKSFYKVTVIKNFTDKNLNKLVKLVKRNITSKELQTKKP